MNIKTGQTVYELVESVDTGTNNPISGATFDSTIFINGAPTSLIAINSGYASQSAATYYFSWSASTFGFHQLHVKNLTTNVIYISEIYNVLSDAEIDPSPTIYVGL